MKTVDEAQQLSQEVGALLNLLVNNFITLRETDADKSFDFPIQKSWIHEQLPFSFPFRNLQFC